MSDAEFEALRAERAEQWKASLRSMSVDHALTSVLPRVTTAGARLGLAPRAVPLRGDLARVNPLAFHLLHIVPMLLGLGVTWAVLHTVSASLVDHTKLRAFNEGRVSMSKQRHEQLKEATQPHKPPAAPSLDTAKAERAGSGTPDPPGQSIAGAGEAASRLSKLEARITQLEAAAAAAAAPQVVKNS